MDILFTMRGGRRTNHIFRRAGQSQIFSEPIFPGSNTIKTIACLFSSGGQLISERAKPKVSAGKVFIFFYKCFPVGEWLVGISLFFVSLQVSDIIHISSITTLGVRKFKYLPSWVSIIQIFTNQIEIFL